MNTKLRLLSALILLLAFSCRDASENNTAPDAASDVNVGQQIPLETAKRWIALYQSRSESARKDEPAYSVKAEQLKQVLDAMKNKTGVTFHHATDETGAHHILITAIDKAGLWNSPVVVDANTNTLIEPTKASTWAKRYEDANSGKIRYHFFGMNVFKEITANSGFNYMDVTPAFNDDLAPQLLLVVWNDKNKATGGRIMTDLPTVYDLSSPCPPYCNTK